MCAIGWGGIKNEADDGRAQITDWKTMLIKRKKSFSGTQQRRWEKSVMTTIGKTAEKSPSKSSLEPAAVAGKKF